MKLRVPLPKQTEAVFKDKRKYDRKKTKKIINEEVGNENNKGPSPLGKK